MQRAHTILFCLSVWLVAVGRLSAETIPLSALDLTLMRQGWGTAQTDKACTEKPLSIGGTRYAHGVGSHADGFLWVAVNGATRFRAQVGVDDGAEGKGTVRFEVYGDGRRLFDSGVMKGGQKARAVDVDLTGVKQLALLADSAGDNIHYDHADWAEAAFEVTGKPPVAIAAPVEEKVIRTPRPGPAPAINGPAVYGVRPGHPVIYRVPTTGERPIRFSAEGLPPALALDAEKGIVTGAAPAEKGRYTVTFTAANAHGKDARKLTFVVGDTLALTPPMGWNHWYTHYDHITDALMRQAADTMVDSGMADVGYSYVNIDDCWMVKPGANDPELGGEPREADGTIRANKRFPDMRGLADYIHAYGLKAGLYTSPGPRTCARFEGAYKHEAQDARTFAAWGYDFLKYDWCSYGGTLGHKPSLEEMKAPYALMGGILKTLDRDIVLNLCQYGMGNVSAWGAEVGGHCWRTAGDFGFYLNNLYPVALRNCGLWEYARPGAWNDPDYLLLGQIGEARGMDNRTRPCPMNPSEQYAYMSFWSLMAAPLFFSGDMGQLDDFTLNLLCNPEIIAINQDELGRQAHIVRQSDDAIVLAKPLADGGMAVGLFNPREVPGTVAVQWNELGVVGPQRVRDAWRRKELGERAEGIEASLGRHGAEVFRLTPTNDDAPPAVSVVSPDGKVRLELSLLGGRPYYALSFDGTEMITRSPMGVELADHPFEGGFSIAGASTRTWDTSWKPVWGKKSTVRDYGTEVVFSLRENGGAKRRLDIVARAYNDGAALRYAFPEQPALDTLTVSADQMAFSFAGDFTMWSANGEHHNIGPVPVSQFKGSLPPATFRAAPDRYMAILEAGIYDFCNFSFKRIAPRTLGVNMGRSTVKAPIATSWRAFVLGRTPGALLESDLLVNLNPPCAIEDPSWIKPGLSMWDWRSWGAKTADGFTYGLDMASWKRHIDFASKHGVRYLLLDANWYGPEFDKTSNPMTPREGVDITGLIAYGKERHVGIILYINDVARKNFDFEKTLALYHAWGAAGIKYGFMKEAGQNKVRATRTIIELCARNELLCNFHDGPIPPSGDRRTWPNCLTREYCHSQSDAKRAFKPVTMVTTVFVNMLAGGLDMCNGLFDLKEPSKTRPRIFEDVPSTVASEVARVLITFGGLSILPDCPESYELKADLFDFIGRLPMTWDDTRVLNGDIGRCITVARRSGAEWFVGSAINEEGGELDIPLSFLGAGDYVATFYEDGPDADYLKNRESYRVREAAVRAGDTVKARLAPGGGHAIWIRPRTAPAAGE